MKYVKSGATWHTTEGELLPWGRSNRYLTTCGMPAISAALSEAPTDASETCKNCSASPPKKVHEDLCNAAWGAGKVAARD